VSIALLTVVALTVAGRITIVALRVAVAIVGIVAVVAALT
jgi:hypothetical protein